MTDKTQQATLKYAHDSEGREITDAINASYNNPEEVPEWRRTFDAMSDQEKSDLYDSLCMTFLGRPARD